MSRTNSNRESIIMVGGFSESIELAIECGKEIVGFIDPHLEGSYYDIPVLGDDDDAAAIHERYPGVPAFITIDEPVKRARLVELYEKAGFTFANLIHPQAKVSPTAKIGIGVFVQYGVHVSANVTLKDHVRVNVYANLIHDTHVGRCTTIAPNALLLGRARVGELTYVGAHSTILPDVEVGARCTVGAQANVTKPVADDTVVVGNPARPLQR